MANYQFYFALFPKTSLLKIKGGIPKKLNFNNDTGFFGDDSNIYWKNSNIDSSIIITEIDNLISRASWGNDELSYNWKVETNLKDNDVWISLDENKNFIKEFYFRVDLRDRKLDFLKNMINLAQKYNLLLNDYSGNLVAPNFDDVISLIKKSNSHKNHLKK